MTLHTKWVLCQQLCGVRSEEDVTHCIHWTVTQGKARAWTATDKDCVSSVSANAVYLYTLTVYRAERQLTEFPITSSPTSCFHCWEETCTRACKQNTAFQMQCGRTLTKRSAPGDPLEHALACACAWRRKMRGCFSPSCLKGRRKTCQTKQWLPWRHQSFVLVTWHADNRWHARKANEGQRRRQQQLELLSGSSSAYFFSFILKYKNSGKLNDIQMLESHQPSAYLTDDSRHLGKAFA